MPRVCPQAAYESSTFPGLGPPEYLDPAGPRAWGRIESSCMGRANVEWVVRRQDGTILRFSSGHGRY